MTVDLLALIIIFFALLVRATLGFGDGLVAMPLLTMSIGMQYAAPIVGLLGLSMALFIALSSWKDIEFGAAAKLLGAAVFGVPVGVLGLKQLPSEFLIAGLAIFLIGFGVYSLLRPTLHASNKPFWAYALGFLGGMFGGAYNIPGPPVVLYGSLRQWNPATFRASVQGFFLVSYSLAVLSHGLTGMWNAHVLKLYLFSLPVLLLTGILGQYLSKLIEPEMFSKFLYIAIIILGALLFI